MIPRLQKNAVSDPETEAAATKNQARSNKAIHQINEF